jgi:anti-sigma regulatory factor (Ser/Thr protein kinase)
VTAPQPSDRAAGRDAAWRTLAELSVPSEPGNERQATDEVAEAVRPLGLAPGRLEKLKTAVAEATMNAMEHGNRYRPEVPVVIEVLTSSEDLSVRITDEGEGPLPSPESQAPDLEAKLDYRRAGPAFGGPDARR